MGEALAHKTNSDFSKKTGNGLRTLGKVLKAAGFTVVTAGLVLLTDCGLNGDSKLKPLKQPDGQEEAAKDGIKIVKTVTREGDFVYIADSARAAMDILALYAVTDNGVVLDKIPVDDWDRNPSPNWQKFGESKTFTFDTGVKVIVTAYPGIVEGTAELVIEIQKPATGKKSDVGEETGFKPRLGPGPRTKNGLYSEV